VLMIQMSQIIYYRKRADKKNRLLVRVLTARKAAFAIRETKRITVHQQQRPSHVPVRLTFYHHPAQPAFYHQAGLYSRKKAARPRKTLHRPQTQPPVRFSAKIQSCDVALRRLR